MYSFGSGNGADGWGRTRGASDFLRIVERGDMLVVDMYERLTLVNHSMHLSRNSIS